MIDNDRDSAGRHLHYVTDNFPESELGEKAQKIIDAYREFDYFRDGLPIHLRTLLARSFNQINEPTLAIWLLRDVLTEKTDYRDAWILLGYAYYNLQQFSLAEDAFYKAYELDTEKPETQFILPQRREVTKINFFLSSCPGVLVAKKAFDKGSLR